MDNDFPVYSEETHDEIISQRLKFQKEEIQKLYPKLVSKYFNDL